MQTTSQLNNKAGLQKANVRNGVYTTNFLRLFFVTILTRNRSRKKMEPNEAKGIPVIRLHFLMSIF